MRFKKKKGSEGHQWALCLSLQGWRSSTGVSVLVVEVVNGGAAFKDNKAGKTSNGEITCLL